MTISGVFPPVTTPFEDGKFSPEKLTSNIERYNRVDLGGYVILGSNGEASFLHEEERIHVWETARKSIPDEKIIIAGTGLESTSATIQLSKIAHDCGADIALVITPHFFKKQMTGDTLIAHYTAVADASPIPVLLYNNPIVTGVEIPLEAVKKLSSHQNIAGMKDSSGDLARLDKTTAAVPKAFHIISGGALVFADSVFAGAAGGILAASDFMPEALVQLFKLASDGKKSEANALQKAITPAIKQVISDHGVAGIKAALDIRGLYGGPPRLPLQPVSSDIKVEIKKLLEGLVADGILPSLAL